MPFQSPHGSSALLSAGAAIDDPRWTEALAVATLLKKRGDHYDIVHFDGHGGHRRSPNPDSYLIFEADDGAPEEISTKDLNALFQEHPIPIVVLNACESGKQAPTATDPSASISASLLNAGVSGVLAMSYSITVGAAEVFFPSFYQELLHTGSLTAAASAGRRTLLRLATDAPGDFLATVDHWVIPVVYEQSAT